MENILEKKRIKLEQNEDENLRICELKILIPKTSVIAEKSSILEKKEGRYLTMPLYSQVSSIICSYRVHF